MSEARRHVAHSAFVIGAASLALGGWNFLLARPASMNDLRPILDAASAITAPSITVQIILGMGTPGEEAWSEFEQSVQRRVGRATSIAFFQRRRSQPHDGAEQPTKPAAFSPGSQQDDAPSATGAYQLEVGCQPSQEDHSASELVIGLGRTAWASIPCTEGFTVDLAKLGRAYATAMLRPTMSCFAGPRFCLNATASSSRGSFAAHMELAVEASGRRWRFGQVEAALLRPALRRLAPAVRLRFTSIVTHTGRLPTTLDALGHRVVTLDDLSAALAHGL